jgi:iron complex outermembrane receptor protein
MQYTMQWPVPAGAAVPARVRRALCALALAGLPVLACAASGPQGDGGASQLADLPLDALLDVQVSGASKFEQRQSETSAAVTVITAAEIRALGWRTLAEALRSIPGLTVADDRSYSYLSVRGFFVPGDYNTRVLLLVDGNRTNDPVYDQAYLGDEFALDLDLVDRIEFIPGPGSAVYGANALFGVINVITRKPFAHGTEGAVASVGSGGRKQLRVGDSHRLADGTSLQWSASRRLADGLDVQLPGGPVVHGADYEQRTSLYLRADHGDLGAQVLYADRLKGAPAVVDTVPGDPRTLNRDEQSMMQLQWQHALDPENQVTARWFVGHYAYVGQYAFDVPPVTVNRDDVSGQWWGLEGRWFSTAWAGHKLVAGAEIQDMPHLRQANHDVGTETLYLHEDDSSHRAALYAEDQVSLTDGLGLTAGARWDHNKRYAGQLSPRLALVWRPEADLVAKLIHGSAYRPPNAYEAFYEVDTIGGYKTNPALQPEKVTGDELAVEWRPGTRDRWTASLYLNRATGLLQLVADPADGLLQFHNAGATQSRGLELQAEHAFAGGGRLRAGVSLQHAEDGEVVAPIAVYAPRQLANLTAIVPVGCDGRVGLEWEGVARRANVPGYGVANLTLSRVLPAHGWSWSASVFDLFDRRHSDPGADMSSQPEVPQAGRTFRFRLDRAF